MATMLAPTFGNQTEEKRVRCEAYFHSVVVIVLDKSYLLCKMWNQHINLSVPFLTTCPNL